MAAATRQSVGTKAAPAQGKICQVCLFGVVLHVAIYFVLKSGHVCMLYITCCVYFIRFLISIGIRVPFIL